VLAALTWLASIYILRGVDWHFHFQPDTTLWLSGDTQLFDEESPGFYYPPWGVWFLVPFVLLPEVYGLALLRITSLLMVTGCAWVFTRPGKQRLWGIVLAIINLHTWDLVYRGQITALEALGPRSDGWQLKNTAPGCWE
jgi:hypothetical protein